MNGNMKLCLSRFSLVSACALIVFELGCVIVIAWEKEALRLEHLQYVSLIGFVLVMLSAIYREVEEFIYLLKQKLREQNKGGDIQDLGRGGNESEREMQEVA